MWISFPGYAYLVVVGAFATSRHGSFEALILCGEYCWTVFLSIELGECGQSSSLLDPVSPGDGQCFAWCRGDDLSS